MTLQTGATERGDALLADIDVMRDMYLTRAQREAFDRITAAALTHQGETPASEAREGDNAWQEACRGVYLTPLSRLREKYGTGDLYAAVRMRADALRAAAPKPATETGNNYGPTAGARPGSDAGEQAVGAAPVSHGLARQDDPAGSTLLHRVLPVIAFAHDRGLIGAKEIGREVEAAIAATETGSTGADARQVAAVRAWCDEMDADARAEGFGGGSVRAREIRELMDAAASPTQDAAHGGRDDE